MSKKYDLIEGIGACYNYILKHTGFEPSDDLYQDVAADYIERYNRGKSHQQIINNLIKNYQYRCNKMNNEILPDCYIMNPIVDEDTMIFECVGKSNINKVLETLTDREQDVLYFRFTIGMDLEDVAKVFGVTRERVRQIENKAIRKLRHPMRTKLIRDFY